MENSITVDLPLEHAGIPDGGPPIASALPVPFMSERPRTRAAVNLVGGFGVIAGCFVAGAWLVDALGLLAPGSVIGMLLLLALIATGVVPIRLVESASFVLLLILPALFVPLYVAVFAETAFWAARGAVLVPLVLAGNTILLLVTWRVMRSAAA